MDFFSFLAGSAEMFFSFSLGEDLTTDQLTTARTSIATRGRILQPFLQQKQESNTQLNAHLSIRQSWSAGCDIREGPISTAQTVLFSISEYLPVGPLGLGICYLIDCSDKIGVTSRIIGNEEER